MTFYKMQISCRQLSTHLFWAYMTLVAFHHFGQPLILSTAAATVRPPASSASARKSLSSATSVTNVPYVRKSRDTGGLSATSAPESIDGQEQFGGLTSSALSSHSGGGGFFPYPSFKLKHQPRISRFHGESSHPATRSFSIRSMTSFPKLNPLAGILSMKSSEVRQPSMYEMLNDEGQDPTFTPFISARALSNIPQFFQHLRDNLEALQFDDDEEGDEDGDSIHGDRLLGQSADALFPHGNDEGRSLNIPRLPEKQSMRWMPSTAGMVGRAHIRHFVSNPEQDLVYKKPANNPARNAYEFGLG